jgi:pimeloyl-ACP methyl ester carboxylesterase
MTSFTVDTPRGPVAASESGAGPVLALVAGLGSTAKIWGDLPRVLARHFTVLTIDNRGVGGSRVGRGFSLADAPDDLTAVLDARGHHDFSLLGVSMGGLISLATALEIPRRVRCLVLASCAAHLSQHGRRVLELLRELMRHLPPERVGAALMSLAFAPPFSERFPAFVDEAAALYGLEPADLSGAQSQLERLLDGWDLRPQLPELATPALVLYGGRDPVVAAEDTEALASALPTCETLRLPDAAHSVLAEGGGETLDRIVAFVKRHGSGEAATS